MVEASAKMIALKSKKKKINCIFLASEFNEKPIEHGKPAFEKFNAMFMYVLITKIHQNSSGLSLSSFSSSFSSSSSSSVFLDCVLHHHTFRTNWTCVNCCYSFVFLFFLFCLHTVLTVSLWFYALLPLLFSLCSIQKCVTYFSLPKIAVNRNRIESKFSLMRFRCLLFVIVGINQCATIVIRNLFT